MFSPSVVDTDKFLEMSSSAQNLYFHLGVRADDDGFVSSPKKIMVICNASDDDMKVLVAKGYIIPFESGVVVISSWRINNLVRKDWYKPTVHQEEMAQLKEKDGVYLVNEPLTIRSRRLGKVRLGKVRLLNTNTYSELSSQIAELINTFKGINPMINFGNKTTRASSERLIKEYGFEKALAMAKQAVAIQGRDRYVPVITTPHQLCEKLGQLKIYLDKNRVDVFDGPLL